MQIFSIIKKLSIVTQLSIILIIIRISIILPIGITIFMLSIIDRLNYRPSLNEYLMGFFKPFNVILHASRGVGHIFDSLYISWENNKVVALFICQLSNISRQETLRMKNQDFSKIKVLLLWLAALVRIGILTNFITISIDVLTIFLTNKIIFAIYLRWYHFGSAKRTLICYIILFVTSLIHSS